jgi:hypothetical protein
MDILNESKTGRPVTRDEVTLCSADHPSKSGLRGFLGAIWLNYFHRPQKNSLVEMEIDISPEPDKRRPPSSP